MLLISYFSTNATFFQPWNLSQLPADPEKAIKDMAHDSCWLSDHTIGGDRVSGYPEDETWAHSWRHGQKWQQPDAMDSGKFIICTRYF